jgi:hypothetical protein
LPELAASARNGIEFWKGLNQVGRRIAVEGGFAAILIVLGAVTSLFAAVRVFSLGVLGAATFDKWVGRWLNPFRPSRAVLLGAFVLGLAVATSSGLTFRLIEYAQVAMK